MFRKKIKNNKSGVKTMKNKSKNVILRLFSLLFAFITLFPVVAEASNAYFLTFTYNPEVNMISAGSTLSEVSNGFTKQAEIENGHYYLMNKDKNLQFRMNKNKNKTDVINIAVPSKLSDFEDYFVTDKKHYKKYDKDYKLTLPFSFPGTHVGTGTIDWTWDEDGDNARQATAQDEMQANFVGQNLTNGLNKLIGVAYQARFPNGGGDVEDLHKVAQQVAQLGVKGKSNGVYSKTFGSEKNGTQITITRSPAPKGTKKVPGIESHFYKKFKITSTKGGYSEELTVPVAVNKGYDGGDDARMTNAIKGTPYHKEKKHLSDVYSLTWEHAVMQAGANAQRGTLLADVDRLNPPGRFESAMLTMFGGITGQLRTLLGLNSVTDLVFNQGMQRETTKSGTIPTTMVPVADFVYGISAILAILIAIGSFVSLLIKSNLSIMNPQMRVSIKDGFMKILGAMFVLVMFKPIWNTALRINASLVDFFYALSGNPTELADAFTGSGWATIILGIAFIIIEVWFNFFYITRTITILILYMFAPLMIISISYGGQYKKIFNNWAKESIGIVFIQTIHASVLGVLTLGMSRGLASSVIWQFVILISIIPLSNLLRKSILGLGGDTASGIAEGGEKAALMTTAVGAGLALKGASTATSTGVSKIAESTGGGSGGGGGGSSYNGGGSSIAGSTGKTKMGDEATDKNSSSQRTGNAIYQDEIKDMNPKEVKAHNQELKDDKAYRDIQEDPKQFARDAAQQASDSLKSGVNKVAQAANSDVARTGASAITETAGGLITAGAAIGDVATDGGSSQAVIAAGRVMSKKGGGGSYKGGSGGKAPNYSKSADIVNEAPPKKELDNLRSMGKIGNEGALTLQDSADGSQILTSDKESFMNDTGYTDIQSFDASEGHRNGTTVATYDSSNMNTENEGLLASSAQITQDYHNGRDQGTLTDETEEKYHKMQEATGMSNVDVVGESESGAPIYDIEFDNETMGWEGTATTDKEVHVKADARTSKAVPNFNDNRNPTNKMNNQLFGEDERQKQTGGQ